MALNLQKLELSALGHGRGINSVATEVVKHTDGSFEVTKAVINRTARRILDGYVYVKTDVINAAMNED